MNTHKYRAFGLCFSSDFEIDFLEKYESNSVDLRITTCDELILPHKHSYELPNYAKITAYNSLYYKKDVGLFEIDNPGLIKYKNISKKNKHDFARVLLGLPFGYYIHSDNLVLHGSAVSKKDTAFGFIGKSGTGKSTLALECLENGFNFITEDILVVDDGNVRTSLPFVKSSEYFIKKYDSFLFGKKYTFDSDHLNRVGIKIRKNKFTKKNTQINKLVLLCCEETSANKLYKEKNPLKLFRLLFESTFKPNPLYLDKDHTKVIMDRIMNLIESHDIYIADFSLSKVKNRNEQIMELICK